MAMVPMETADRGAERFPAAVPDGPSMRGAIRAGALTSLHPCALASAVLSMAGYALCVRSLGSACGFGA